MIQKFIADFHIHSKYARATSKDADVENLDKWAKIKGIDILGTGDFTHPLWVKELKEKTEPAEDGLFKIKPRFKIKNGIASDKDTRFILTGEISSIYSKNGKVRKVHNLIFAPSFDVLEKINAHLGWIGNLKSDGRPILGLDSKELAKIILNISEKCLIVPCHAYTPWFSIFGSRSGFDSIEECFEEYTKYIYAIETGLSSDPEASWANSSLDNITLLSNSDAHSPSKLGREVNVFEGSKINYDLIRDAIKNGPNSAKSETGDGLKLIKTIEFFPEEGKYHWDGHRNCDLRLSPEESIKYNNICPRCGKPLTIGVMNRVFQLADRKLGEKPEKFIPFQKSIPLNEIIADVLETGVNTKTVDKYYKDIIKIFGNEFNVLIDVKEKEISNASSPEIAQGIERVRQGNVYIEPGFDGEFGKINIFNSKDKENKSKKGQEVLF